MFRVTAGHRTRGGPDRIHRQLVTGRRYTGLTVTFSRPTEAPLEPPTGSEEQSSRSFPTSTVSLSRLGLAHHPHRAGAGAGSALTDFGWPRPRERSTRPGHKGGAHRGHRSRLPNSHRTQWVLTNQSTILRPMHVWEREWTCCHGVMVSWLVQSDHPPK